MDMQDVSNLTIPEGQVRTIHDKDSRLLWGRVNYDTKYKGNTTQQTYSGKNLLDPTPGTYGIATVVKNADGTITCTGTSTTNTYYNFMTYQRALPGVIPAGTYTFSRRGTDKRIVIRLWDTNKANPQEFAIPIGQTSVTVTTVINAYYINGYVGITAGTTFNDTFALMLEAGSLASEFEPFVGSVANNITPSPNPSYPQDINVVTGEQVVSITDGANTQNFTVNLGSTELVKIGNYQDYIYKSGNDWYVHKACRKVVLNGGESWSLISTSTNTARFRSYDINNFIDKNSEIITISDYFTCYPSNERTQDKVGFTTYRNSDMYIRTDITTISSLSDFTTWLSTHNTTVYYVLATATDTQITDSTLVEQLNAVHQWLTRYGYNATVSGNLPMIIDRTNL